MSPANPAQYFDRWGGDMEPSMAGVDRVFREEWQNTELDGVLRGNCSLGQLTAEGSRMLQAVGADLREQYLVDGGLLGASPSLADISRDGLVALRSTDVPRTKASLMSLVSTLFPAETGGDVSVLPVCVWAPIAERSRTDRVV